MYKASDIQTEQAKTLYQQSPMVLVATLSLVVTILFFFKERLDQGFLVPWAIWLLILTSARAYLVGYFRKQENIEYPTYWLKLFAATTFISGVSWGVLLLQALYPVSNNEVLFISFVLMGMVGGSLLSLSCYLPAYFSFSIPVLIPFAIQLFIFDSTSFSYSGFLAIIFLVAMLGLSITVNRNVIDSIKLRLMNVDLLKDLKIQKKLADIANSDKSRFLTATSHDLRQPLYAIDLYLGALQAELQSSKQFELLDKVKISSKTLADLLNSLMDVFKLDSGEVQTDFKYFDLTKMLTDMSAEYEQQAKEKGIEIKTSLDKAVVNTDPVLLGRILRNLISNAINHNEDCCLTISTTLNNGEVRVAISDSGKGIAALELDNIFSEFYQLNNPERDKNKGLGLGLAIVKRLSSLLNIHIEVASEEGKGSQFSLILPLETDGRKTPPQQKVDLVSDLDLAGLFVVVVDDEETVRDATKMLLRSWGCEVLSASSQSELIATLSQDDYPVPDLLISDYRLRDNKSGLDAVAAVYDYFKAEIPVIIITGDSSEKIASEVTAENHMLVLKPINSQTLREKIEKLLKG